MEMEGLWRVKGGIKGWLHRVVKCPKVWGLRGDSGYLYRVSGKSHSLVGYGGGGHGSAPVERPLGDGVNFPLPHRVPLSHAARSLSDRNPRSDRSGSFFTQRGKPFASFDDMVQWDFCFSQWSGTILIYKPSKYYRTEMAFLSASTSCLAHIKKF